MTPRGTLSRLTKHKASQLKIMRCAIGRERVMRHVSKQSKLPKANKTRQLPRETTT